jgi:hypothetical protein
MNASRRNSVGLVLLLSLATQVFPLSLLAQSRRAPDDHSVEVVMNNVMYHFTDRIMVHILHLQGRLFPSDPAAIVVFDDKNSFILHIEYAEIAINFNSLAQTLNQKVFAADGSPIKDVTIASVNNQIVIRGKLPQKAGVSFETVDAISADSDGQIRLHSDHVKAAHLPVKGLLDVLGIDLAELINTKKVRGVVVDKDDIVLDPTQILPPPRIRGKVSAVRLQGEAIVLVFGEPREQRFAEKEPGNYMAYRDHDLQFGKLTMHDADLTLLDMDPRDPFEFFLDHYKEQLVAGYSKTTPASGLRVYMPDYAKLKNRPRK